MTIDKREHPRYTVELPVAVTLGEVVASESAYLSNISAGGVLFNSMVELAPGTLILLHVPPGKPLLRTPGRVVWCTKHGFEYEVGAEFLIEEPIFRDRMLSVVRRIEEYRRELMASGRVVTGQEAMLEWIELHGPQFFEPEK